jgi:hypothetical protein
MVLRVKKVSARCTFVGRRRAAQCESEQLYVVIPCYESCAKGPLCPVDLHPTNRIRGEKIAGEGNTRGRDKITRIPVESDIRDKFHPDCTV